MVCGSSQYMLTREEKYNIKTRRKCVRTVPSLECQSGREMNGIGGRTNGKEKLERIR